jgi:hypothetical protein
MRAIEPMGHNLDLTPPRATSEGGTDNKGTPDVIAASMRSLVPRLMHGLDPEAATELVEWLMALHDRLLVVEAENHHLRAEIELINGEVPL